MPLSSSVLPEERQAVLLEALRLRDNMTVVEAWQVGHILGFYKGGDGMVAKSDLNALCKRRQACKHDGFWRHAHEPDRVRNRCRRWADYWTAR